MRDGGAAGRQEPAIRGKKQTRSGQTPEVNKYTDSDDSGKNGPHVLDGRAYVTREPDFTKVLVVQRRILGEVYKVDK